MPYLPLAGTGLIHSKLRVRLRRPQACSLHTKLLLLSIIDGFHGLELYEQSYVKRDLAPALQASEQAASVLRNLLQAMRLLDGLGLRVLDLFLTFKALDHIPVLRKLELTQARKTIARGLWGLRESRVGV